MSLTITPLDARSPVLPAERPPADDLIGCVAYRLAELHSNSVLAVPLMQLTAKGKDVVPFKHPDWRIARDAVQLRAREEARANGQDEDAAAALALARAKRAYDLPDRFDYWRYHVRGTDDRGGDFYRGVYEHRKARYDAEEGRGLDVCWDVDKEHANAQGIAQRIVDELHSLALGSACYVNVSSSARGYHVRLCLGSLEDSRLRRAFGEQLLRRLGLREGNHASQGQVEVFPKSDPINEVGNQIALPLALPRMQLNGGTSLCDEQLQPVPDLAWALARLDAVSPASRERFHGAARAIGLDPAHPVRPREAEAAQEAEERAKRRAITVRTRGGELRRVVPPSARLDDPLADAIRAHADPVALQDWLGIGAAERMACPVHGGDNPTAFVRFYASRLGHWRWRCHTACNTSWCAIGLYVALKRVTWNEARLALADWLGLDPAAFQASAPDEAPAEGVVPALEPLAAPPLLASWCGAALQRILALMPAKLGRGVLAAGRVLLEHGLRWEVVAAALWAALDGMEGHSWTESQVRKNVLGLAADLQEGLPRAGASWLRRNLGRRFMRALADALQRTLRLKGDREVISKLVGLNRVRPGTAQHRVLSKLSREIGPKPQPRKIPGMPLVKPPDLHPDAKIRGSVSRPKCCADFANRIRAADSGKRLTDVKLRCDNQLVCPQCSMIRMLGERALLLEEELDEESPYSWHGRGPFHFAIVTLPSWDDYERTARTIARHYECAKLRALGWSRHGDLQLMYVSADNEILGVGFEDYPVETFTLRRAEEAVQRVIDHKLSGGYYFEDLCMVPETNPQHEQVIEQIKRFLHFTRGRHLVRASKEGLPGWLPWPPRSEVKSVVTGERGDLREYPEQELSYDLVHVETDYTLASGSDVPFTIDQAISLAARDVSFQFVLESRRLDQQHARGGSIAHALAPP